MFEKDIKNLEKFRDHLKMYSKKLATENSRIELWARGREMNPHEKEKMISNNLKALKIKILLPSIESLLKEIKINISTISTEEKNTGETK